MLLNGYIKVILQKNKIMETLIVVNTIFQMIIFVAIFNMQIKLTEIRKFLRF